MTRRSSVRAQARRIYGETTEAAAPTPDPSLASAFARGASADKSGGGETQLTARVRKLYEESAVPVAAIARIAGVTERTVYKYARKGNWRPRYAWAGEGGRPASRPARGRLRAERDARAQSFAPDFVPVRGAGGRFVARAEAGKPFARGLKATDRAAERRAAAQCAEAEAIAAQAQAEAEWELWNGAFVECLKTAAGLRDALAAHRRKRRQKLGMQAAGVPDFYEQTLERCGHIALDGLQLCQAHRERCLARMMPGARLPSPGGGGSAPSVKRGAGVG
jgi:hypothetical protein